MVLDHVAGFCQLQQKTPLWIVPGRSSGLKEHSTKRKRISNLPFTELYSPHNNAGMHWLLAHCLNLNFPSPYTHCSHHHHTHAGSSVSSANTHKQSRSLLPPPNRQDDQHCLTFTLLLHISGHMEHRGCALDSLIHSHPQSYWWCEHEHWKPPHGTRQQFRGFSLCLFSEARRCFHKALTPWGLWSLARVFNWWENLSWTPVKFTKWKESIGIWAHKILVGELTLMAILMLCSSLCICDNNKK